MIDMQLIFFENPENRDRVAMTLSDKGVEYLKAIDVIPQDSKLSVLEYSSEMSDEDFLRNHNVNYLKFTTNPPYNVEVDFDLAIFDHIEILKEESKGVLKVLDKIQTRLLVRGDDEGVQAVEKDRTKVKNLSSFFEGREVGSLVELYNTIPPCLLIDYAEKYGVDEDDL